MSGCGDQVLSCEQAQYTACMVLVIQSLSCQRGTSTNQLFIAARDLGQLLRRTAVAGRYMLENFKLYSNASSDRVIWLAEN
jgi:hypothetical protein